MEARLVTALVATAAVLCTASTGCGGGSSSATSAASSEPVQTAGLFYSSLIREKATGQYELAWKSLHPIHQRVAPEAKYVRCENRTAFPGRLLKISVLRVKDEPVLIAGERETVPSKAVTIRVSVASPGIPRPVVVTDTYHAIAVNGHWTWILTKGNYAEYKAGHCPGVAPASAKA